jgi:hypothetical protein
MLHVKLDLLEFFERPFRLLDFFWYILAHLKLTYPISSQITMSYFFGNVGFTCSMIAVHH